MIDNRVYRKNGNFRLLFSPKFSKKNDLKFDDKFTKLLYYNSDLDILEKCLINHHQKDHVIVEFEDVLKSSFTLHKNIEIYNNTLIDKEKSFLMNKKEIANVISQIKIDL